MSPRRQSRRSGSARQAEGAFSADQVQTLLTMLEEEKLAGDLYDAFAAQTGLPIFTRIGESEDRHASALLRMTEAAHLNVDAITGLPAGTYVNHELQQLYNTLLQQGSKGATEALQVAVVVEQTDIADLQAAMIGLEGTSLGETYSRLLQGSMQHLEAFSSWLDSGY
jgi:hypothetical protein